MSASLLWNVEGELWDERFAIVECGVGDCGMSASLSWHVEGGMWNERCAFR